MSLSHSKSRPDAHPAFKITTNNAILPQRFHLERQRLLKAKQAAGNGDEIEAVGKVDELLSTCKPESIQRMISQKMMPAKKMKVSDSEPVFTKPAPRVTNQAKMNEIFLATLTSPQPTEVCTPSHPKRTENIADYDEGCAKIKELTKQSDHYQIYQQIQLKHEANGKALNRRATHSTEKLMVSTLSRPRLTAPDDTNGTPDQYLEKKSYFSVPIEFKMPRQLVRRQAVPSSCRELSQVGAPLKLEFPFREEFKEHQITLELSKKAFPGILEVVNKADLGLRTSQNKAPKKNFHEFHLSFNLGLTCELENDLEAANSHFDRFRQFSQEISDHFATCFIKNKIGTNLLRLKRPADALPLFQDNLNALSADKRFVSLYNIGLCFKRQQLHVKAFEAFQRCKEWAETYKVC